MMCGIIACRTSSPAPEFLCKGLRRLEYRGYDSVGIAARTISGDVVRVRTTDGIADLESRLAKWTGPSFDGLGIGHTRWATHGAVNTANAHPHMDCSGRISLVHNGIIDNDEDLRRRLTASGHTFASSVDSEVLSHLIEDHLRRCGDLFDAVHSAMNEVVGTWALAVLDQVSGRIVLTANKSPLLIARTAVGDFAASDFAAIADWTDDFQVLADGDIVELTAGDRWARNGSRVTPPSSIHSGWQASDVELGDHTDYMAKEIDEQPEIVARLLDSFRGRIANGALWGDACLPPFERVHVIACGTSLHAGLVIAHVLRRLGGIPVRCSVASEAAGEIVEPRTLRLAISQSGETADVLRALDAISASAFPILGVSNNPLSTLGRRADALVGCGAGPEIGVAATKTFVCQIVAGSALMISALVGMGRLRRTSARRVVDELLMLPEQLHAASTKAHCVIPLLAEQMATASGFVFVARGTGLPYAAEGALKVKELTYRWAEHYPAGELKHGPLALIDTGTPVVIVDNADPKLAASHAEIQTRGGYVVSIGAPGSTVPVVGTHDAPWGPLPAAVPLQILARTLALALGRDVDKPRNLAKSVTVE